MSSDDDPPESDHISRSAQVTAVVLAAGRGRRLQSATPKPLFPICGRAMASHVLHALAAAGIDRAVVVTPPSERGAEIVAALRSDAPAMPLAFAVQDEPRGTADAVLSARQLADSPYVVVVNGDLPLLTSEQIAQIVDAPTADVVIATAHVDDPAKMGRLVRGSRGELRGIVEFADASLEQRAVREVNLGLYRFRTDFLWDALDGIVSCSAGEAYVTDAVPIAVARDAAAAIDVGAPNGRLNVETLSDAADAEICLQGRIIDSLLNDGVRIRDRRAVWIDATARIESGAEIEPGTHVRGFSIVGRNARIGPNAVIEDASVGPESRLESCTVQRSRLGAGTEVGPYSTIRPGCEIGDRVHIGTHAELKAAQLGDDVQLGHFSYVGDTVVGPRTNIGAGAVTCNFDGTEKHATVIGADVFIGSDTMLIAPVRVGDRARTAAGSVVNKDVPDDGNAVGHPARLMPQRAQQDGEQRP